MAIQVKLARDSLQMVFTIERVSIIEHPASVQIVWEKDMDTIYVSTGKTNTAVNIARQAN